MYDAFVTVVSKRKTALSHFFTMALRESERATIESDAHSGAKERNQLRRLNSVGWPSEQRERE